MSDQTPRPGLLTFGILCTALSAGFYLAAIFLGGLLGIGALGVGMTQAQGEEWIPFGVMALFGGVLLSAFALFYVAVLIVCAGAWTGGRYWLYALVAVSILGMINAGPLSILVGVLTIVGVIKALEGQKTQAVQAD